MTCVLKRFADDGESLNVTYERLLLKGNGSACVHSCVASPFNSVDAMSSVSYTHLTLPTILRV